MGRKPTWKSGQTTAIRIPEQFADRLVDLARAWDAGAAPPGQLPQAAGEGAAAAGGQWVNLANPARVAFTWEGERREGRAVAALMDWRAAAAAAIVIDWEMDGQPLQTQLPIDRVEFCDLPGFRTKKRAGKTVPPLRIQIETQAGVTRYQIGGGYINGELLEEGDRLCDELIDQCEELGIDPRWVYMRLCEQWLKPIEKSA